MWRLIRLPIGAFAMCLVTSPPPNSGKAELGRVGPGAKDKLALRVHGLIVGAPEKQRADPAVLRSLCSHVLPSGHLEVLISSFESWAGVSADPAMQFDWDDAAGNTARREAGLRLEAMRKVGPANPLCYGPPLHSPCLGVRPSLGSFV